MRPPPPPIGSPAWDLELVDLGVTRPMVDGLLHDALGDADAAAISPHSLCFDPAEALRERPEGRLAAALTAAGREASAAALDRGAELALEVAAWFLFHQQQPTYGALMNLRVGPWRAIDRRAPLGRYCARQLAAGLLHGPEAVRDSIWYYLGVDPFEVAEEALTLFPALVDELPAALHDELLDASGHVTWAAKRDFYLRCANDPARHGELARALQRSCQSGFYTSVHAREGLSLLRRLEGVDAALRAAIEAALTRPIRAFVVAAADIDDGRLRAQYPGACVAALAWLDASPPCWLWESELWRGDVFLGRFLRSDLAPYPEGPRPPEWTLRRAADQPPPPEALRRIDWHLVRGPAEEVAAAVGATIELVGPGMR